MSSAFAVKAVASAGVLLETGAEEMWKSVPQNSVSVGRKWKKHPGIVNNVENFLKKSAKIDSVHRFFIDQM
ncbi:MAG: hypothetical protein IJD81_02950 [Oscillospiraceae bacterium]|nr:hypothetical protein [Oscillospiraceae bacterium]